MKKIILMILVLLPLFLSAQYINRDSYSIWQGQMSVGKPNTTRAPLYAWLEVGKDSTTKGLLFPRVINTSAVTAPGRGLVVYSIQDSALKYYTGNQWLEAGAGGGGTNIYNSDGTLTGDRIVDANLNSLTINNASVIATTSISETDIKSQINVGSFAKSRIYMSAGLIEFESSDSGGDIGDYEFPNIVSQSYADDSVVVVSKVNNGKFGMRAIPGGSTNTSIGSGYAAAVTGTNNVKSLTAGWGVLLDSSATEVGVEVDSNAVKTVMNSNYWSLANGGTLTGDNTIVGATKGLEFNDISLFKLFADDVYIASTDNLSDIVLQSAQNINAQAARSSAIYGGYGNSINSALLVAQDSISIYPNNGDLIIDTLNYSGSVDDSMMVWNKSSRRVGMRAVPSGGSGVTGTGTTQYIPKWNGASSLTDSRLLLDESTANTRLTIKNTSSGVADILLTDPSFGYTVTMRGDELGNFYIFSPGHGTPPFAIKQTSANIGLNNTTPDASALLDMTSTAKGLLVPRMTTTQRAAISTPANGLIAYDSIANTLGWYNGSAWKTFADSATGGGVTSLAAIGSSPNANGATISGSVLNLEPASAAFGGVLTNGLQIIAGDKDFKKIGGTTDFTQINFEQPEATYGAGQGLTALALGSAYSTSGSFMADGGWFGANAGLSAGLNLVATNASAPMRFYTGGSADANLRLTIASSGAATFTGLGHYIAPAGTITTSDVVSRITANAGSGSQNLFNLTGDGGWLWNNSTGTNVFGYGVGADLITAYRTFVAPEVRVSGAVKVGSVQGTNWGPTNKIEYDNAWVMKYYASGDGGSDLIGHHFIMSAAMTGTNSKLAAWNNAGADLISFWKNGSATFAEDVTVPDEVYGAGWNGSLEVPTKNALYDKIETLSPLAGSASLTTVGTIGSGTWQGSTINYAYLGSGGGGATKFLREDNTWQTVSGSGDMVLASAQTNSGVKTFLDGTMKLRNVANTFDGYFVNTNTADRIYTLQNAAGTLAFLSDITGTNSGTNTGDQTLSASGTTTTYGIDLSASGGTVNLIEGTNITIDRTGNDLTINSAGGGVTTFAALTDVNLTSLATNDFLKWDGTDWINRTPANVRTDLSLVVGTNVQAWDADLDTYAGITPSSNIQTYLGAADYAAMRTQLGLVIGTNVQAYDADLTTWAGITPTTLGTNLVSLTNPSAVGYLRTNADNTVTHRSYANTKVDLSLDNVDNTSDATKNSATATLTNKRITIRTGTTTSSATPTINTDNVDKYSLTAQTVDITSFTTNLSGTPTEGQKLLICITGTASRAITWGASFVASAIALPTTTSGTSMLCVSFIWDGAAWRITGYY